MWKICGRSREEEKRIAYKNQQGKNALHFLKSMRERTDSKRLTIKIDREEMHGKAE